GSAPQDGDGPVELQGEDGAFGQVDVVALRGDGPARAAQEDADDRPLGPADDRSQDAAQRGPDARVAGRPRVGDVLLDLDHTRVEVEGGAVVEQHAVEGEVEAPSADGPLRL